MSLVFVVGHAGVFGVGCDVSSICGESMTPGVMIQASAAKAVAC